MKAYTITLMDFRPSWDLGERCIASAAEHGIRAEHFDAVTPADDPVALMAARQFPVSGDGGWPHPFASSVPYSRWLPVLSCFLSHAGLWLRCVARDEPLLIMEHDALVTAPLPELPTDGPLACNVAKPSFGEFDTPPDGHGPLVSKPYFGGAHGYIVNPTGAAKLIAAAQQSTAPTDVFLSTERFPWLTEYHPWPIVCDDSFSTIQLERGCRAKHQDVKPC